MKHTNKTINEVLEVQQVMKVQQGVPLPVIQWGHGAPYKWPKNKWVTGVYNPTFLGHNPMYIVFLGPTLKECGWKIFHVP